MSVHGSAVVWECDGCDSLTWRTGSHAETSRVPSGWFLARTAEQAVASLAFCSARCLRIWVNNLLSEASLRSPE